MKKLILTVMMSAFLGSWAQADVPPPQLSCFFSYSKTDSRGVTKDYKTSPVLPVVYGKENAATFAGFKIQLTLTRICAQAMWGSGNPPCTNSYNLVGRISKNDAAGTMFATINAEEEGFERYSSELTVKDEGLFMNCDLGGPRS